MPTVSGLSPLATANRKPNYFDEIKLLEEIGKIVNVYNQVVFSGQPGKHIAYASSYPDYVFAHTGQAALPNHPSQLICYDIVRKESGSIGPNKFDRNQRVKPILMEQRPITTPSGEQKVQQVLMKHYDLILRFDCLAPSDDEAMRLIRLFEKLMESHSGYLESGVQRFVYHGRIPSYFSRDSEYRSRTCQFYAQVQEFWGHVEEKITSINIDYLNFQQTV